MTRRCKHCRSSEGLVENTTNFAKDYYCTNCDNPANRLRIACPWCDDRSEVWISPFDNHYTYHCYSCEGEFNSTDTFFQSEELEYGSAEPLSMVANEVPDETHNHYKVTLENVADEPVTTQGRQPIVLQFPVVDDEWLTLFGNPEGYVPNRTVQLNPGECLEWGFVFGLDVIRSDITLHNSIFHHRDRLPLGTYRTVYWGAGTAGSLPAAQFEVEYPE